MKHSSQFIGTIGVLGLLASPASAAILDQDPGGTVGAGGTVPANTQVFNTGNDTSDWIDTYGDSGFTGTLYYGFDFTVLNNAGESGGGGLFAGVQLYNGNSERIGAGNDWAPVNIGFVGGSGFADNETSTPYVVGQTYRLVVKVEFFGGDDDDLFLWVDPASEADPADAIDSGNTVFNNIRLRAGNSSGLVGFENIVFATTFAEAAIPEPSSLALLGLGGLCVLRRRRS